MDQKTDMSEENENLKLQKSQNSPVWSYEHSNLPVKIGSDQANYVDTDIISSKFYNSFNYSKLPDKYKKFNLTLGITSAREGEGKTLVSSNLAVSFALGYKKNTVLIDLNYKNPQLHKIFGMDQSPGLTDAMESGVIHLNESKVDHLYVLPIGDAENFRLELNHIMSVSEIISSLEHNFDFIVVDMSSILPIEDFPVLFANEVDGLLTVVDTQKTERSDLDQIYNHLNKNQIVGFIMNRYEGKV